ncbi:thiol reductant ABC exporter subunit CydC [Bacillus massiliigorillae]|uniref:thiol reductant ABC exporter subunit CydC n=1 Tax=Bacillus massiliigorillae TaxID=1243664 RepID=UPI0003A569C9|nr:thiol reductant ABC exporter subunit CydC [Bacillus massiliigorillae]
MNNKHRIVNRALYDSWVKPYLQQNKRLLCLVLLLGTLTFFSASALMFTSGYLISKSATVPENILMVYVPIVLVRTFGIARPIFRYLERLTSHSVVLKFLSAMRVRLYQRLEKQALTLKSRYSTGDLLGVLADDLEHMQNLYLQTIFPSIVALILYTICIIALGFFSIPFALSMLLILFVLIVLFPLVSLLVTRAKQAQIKESRNNLYRTLADAVMGISDWRISGRHEDFLKSYEEQEKLQDELEDQTAQFSRRRNFLFQFVFTLLIISMIWFASSSVDSNVFNHVWIAAFVLVAFPLLEAIAPLPDAISALPSYENSLSRLNEINDSTNIEDEPSHDSIQEILSSRNMTVELNDVTFSYNNETKAILNRVSMTLNQGDRVALLGRSGAGKSTLAKLLLGSITPTSGQITINDIPVPKLKEDIAQLISVLQQKPHLFDSTVMNNIRLGNPKASDEEVIEAAKQVKMHDYISSLPDGYNTRMRELGGRFSGGERQRIALARILLQKTPIVILDEPTVGLDAITERDLLNTIFKTLNGKTVLWITHHLVGVEEINRIIFLEDGHIQMEGTHDHLLQTNSRYANLYQLDRPM